MKFFKKTDILIVVILLLLSVAMIQISSYIYGDRPVVAEIYYESQLVERIDLNDGKNRTFSIPQDEHVVFRVENGTIRFEESDCPDKICIRDGKLHRVGEYAACLPNKITVKIVPKGERSDDDVDIIVGK